MTRSLAKPSALEQSNFMYAGEKKALTQKMAEVKRFVIEN